MKKLLLLAALPLFLIGCNSGGEGGDGGDTSGGEQGENLPYSREQASNKLAELGKGDGFEITYVATADDEKQGEVLFAMKGEYIWYTSGDDHSMIKFHEGALTQYDYDSENSKFKFGSEIPAGETATSLYDVYVTGVTGNFYVAQGFDGDERYHKVKDLTFVGRSATEYRYDIVATGIAEVHYSTIIDKELGITLYWDASGRAYDGEHGSASFEVKSFKTGSDVVVPTIEE